MDGRRKITFSFIPTNSKNQDNIREIFVFQIMGLVKRGKTNIIFLFQKELIVWFVANVQHHSQEIDFVVLVFLCFSSSLEIINFSNYISPPEE